MNAALVRREYNNEEEEGGDRHSIVKWHLLVCHVKILWASEKRHVLWSTASALRSMINASSAVEETVLIIKAELVGFRISIKIDGLGYWVEGSTGHLWIEGYGNFSSLWFCMDRASVPPPLCASIARVSKQITEGTEVMYFNQHPNLCYHTLQHTHPSEELPAATATTATPCHYSSTEFPSYMPFTNRCHIENHISRLSIQQTGNYMEYSCSCVETTIVCPTYQLVPWEEHLFCGVFTTPDMALTLPTELLPTSTIWYVTSGVLNLGKQHPGHTCLTQLSTYPANISVEKCCAESHISHYQLMSYCMINPQSCIEKKHAHLTIGSALWEWCTSHEVFTTSTRAPNQSCLLSVVSMHYQPWVYSVRYTNCCLPSSKFCMSAWEESQLKPTVWNKEVDARRLGKNAPHVSYLTNVRDLSM
jgi:hypothetical protein